MARRCLTSLAMMVNTAKLLHDRMIVQNAADNAALSVAAYKARVLNELGYTNFLIGCLLRDGIPGFTWGIATEEKPFWEFFGGIFNYDGFGFSGSSYGSCPHSTFGFLPMMFHDNQKHVGSIFDMSHEGCPGMDTGFMSSSKNVERISQMVQGLIKLQDAIRLPFPMLSTNYARDIAKRQQINANGKACGADVITIDVLSDPYHKSLSLGLQRNKKGIRYFATDSFCLSIPPNPFIPSGHSHAFWTSGSTLEEKSWLYADRDNFDKTCKIYMHAIKLGNSDSNKGYPLLGRWLGIEWPTIDATAAAAVYNTKGPMFPREESDTISPVMDEYVKAKKGGWYAHLVPMGKIVKH